MCQQIVTTYLNDVGGDIYAYVARHIRHGGTKENLNLEDLREIAQRVSFNYPSRDFARENFERVGQIAGETIENAINKQFGIGILDNWQGRLGTWQRPLESGQARLSAWGKLLFPATFR
jgi:hypothetical protein